MKHVAMVLGYHNPRLSMLAANSALDNDSDVIIVEPGARPQDLKILYKEYLHNPKVSIQPERENRYCAWGMNQGIGTALENGYDTITVMNNDATMDKGYVRHVMLRLKDETIGMVQPKTYFGMTDVLYSAGVERNWAGFPCLRGFGEIDYGQHDMKGTEYASMVITTIRSKLFRQIGLLDEDYIQYYDDIDFSIRARRHGWSIDYCPQAVARHHTLGAIGQTNSKMLDFTHKLSSRNKLLMASKNGFLTPTYILADLLQSLKTCIRSPLLIKPVVEGKLWFLRGS